MEMNLPDHLYLCTGIRRGTNFNETLLAISATDRHSGMLGKNIDVHPDLRSSLSDQIRLKC